jgi:hypothetical protein
MIVSITAACVFGAWAMLRIMGNERQTRLTTIENEIRTAAERAKEEAQAVPEVKSANSR